MKKTLFLCVAVLLLLLTACSEKDDNTTSPNNPTPPAMATVSDNDITMPAENTVFPDSILVNTTYNDVAVQAVPLSYFVPKATTDLLVGNTSDDETQYLFAYHLVASDGFNPRDRGYNDLTWDKLKTGYLLPNNSFRSYFASDSIETAFDVKNLKTIKMYRAVQVIKVDRSKVLFEINTLPTYQVANHDSVMEAAVKLQDFITEYITTTPANYAYELSDNTGYVKTFTWAQIQDGYWLKESKRTIFPSFSDLPNNMKKFKKLMSITLVTPA